MEKNHAQSRIAAAENDEIPGLDDESLEAFLFYILREKDHKRAEVAAMHANLAGSVEERERAGEAIKLILKRLVDDAETSHFHLAATHLRVAIMEITAELRHGPLLKTG